jgi:hypothetical protein
MRGLLGAMAGASLAVLAIAAAAEAQTTLCTGTGFTAAPGTRACDGTASPVTVSATVRTYARLSLDGVFGAPAAGLGIVMGDLDASCVTLPRPGVSCATDPAGGSAIWFGDLTFRVQLSGLGASRARLVGTRPAAGTIPVGRLLDGIAGSPPIVPYPVAPASAATLKAAIGNGDTVVARSIGLRVLGADPPGAWSGDAVFSLVLE